MVLSVIEGLVLSFILLLVCVINIRNGSVGGVQYYEQEVKDRVVELGLITKEQIKRNRSLSGLALMSALIVLSPVLAFCVKATPHDHCVSVCGCSALLNTPNFRQNAHFCRSFTGVKQGKIGYYGGNSASRWHTKVRTGGPAVLP